MTETIYVFVLSRRDRKSEKSEPIAVITVRLKPEAFDVNINPDRPQPMELAAKMISASLRGGGWNIVITGCTSRQLSFSYEELEADDKGYTKHEITSGKTGEEVWFWKTGISPAFCIEFNAREKIPLYEYWLTEIGEFSKVFPS